MKSEALGCRGYHPDVIDKRWRAYTVGLAVTHGAGFAVLSAATAAFVVQTARDPIPDSFAKEDMVQGTALAAGFVFLVLLAMWGTVRAVRGYGTWMLVVPGVVAAVGGSGYAVIAAR